jgi:hypothetical protein
VISGLLSRAQAKHFDTSLLEYTPQPPAGERNTLDAPQGSVPAPPHAGCALASGAVGGRSAIGWWALAIAGLALYRRKSAHRSRHPLAS